MEEQDGKGSVIKKRGWDKSPSLSIIFGLSSKTQWLSGLYYTDFISFYSPTQLCGGGTTKSNSNELPISVPLSLLLLKNYLLMGETCHLLKSPCFVFNSCYNGTIKTLGKEFYES